MDARERARSELLQAFELLGYPEEFGVVVADELHGEKSMRRMAGYLRNARPTNPEQIADEMLAIIAERDRWVAHKIDEAANAKITRLYNTGFEDAED